MSSPIDDDTTPPDPNALYFSGGPTYQDLLNLYNVHAAWSRFRSFFSSTLPSNSQRSSQYARIIRNRSRII